MGIVYATREDVLSAIDMQESARTFAQVDRALNSGARSIEGLLHRKFYPQTGTRYFPWPNRQYARSWRLWLDQDELISVTSLTAGGVEIPDTDYLLEPVNSGPPYTRIEIDLSSASAFASGDTHQRAIAVEGVFGYSADEVQPHPDAVTVGNHSDSTTSLLVVVSTGIGVGSIIHVDDERMIVTAIDTPAFTSILGSDLTASMADVTVDQTGANTFYPGETILIDSERMRVTDFNGDTGDITVRRAVDGSVLAAHSTSSQNLIYTYRTLTVIRGVLGTTAASHTSNTAVYVHEVPGLIRELCIAEAVNTLQQEQSAYARVVGEGDNAIEVRGQGLVAIRADALARYGRRARTRAI